MKIHRLATVLIVFSITSQASQTGCSSTPDAKSVPRETARAAVIMLAKTTALADETCSTLARTKQDATLAKKCADAYDVIRPSLLAAENGVDRAFGATGPAGGGSANRNDLMCSIAKSAAALVNMTEAITAAGGTVPSSVVDSIQFVKSIAEECR